MSSFLPVNNQSTIPFTILKINIPERDKSKINLKIPPEILQLIFEYAVGQSSNKYRNDILIRNIQQVCRRWKDIGKEITAINLSYIIKIYDIDLNALAKICPNLESIELIFCFYITIDSIIFLAQSCRNLKSMKLSCCNSEIFCNKNFPTLIQSCPNLQSIALQAVYLDDNKLKIIINNLINPENLISIDLSSNYSISDDGIIALAKRCVKLQFVYLYNLLRVTDKSLYALAENCPDLKFINLDYPDHISEFFIPDDCLNKLAQDHPKLTITHKTYHYT